MDLTCDLTRLDGSAMPAAVVHLNYIEVQRRDQVARVQFIAYASAAAFTAGKASDRVFDHTFGPEHWDNLAANGGMTEEALIDGSLLMAAALKAEHDAAVASAEAAGTPVPQLADRSIAHLAGAVKA